MSRLSTRENSTTGGAMGLRPPGRGSGVIIGRGFLDAASQAGLQGAQPLPGGLGGVPPASFFSFARFACGETRKRSRVEDVSSKKSLLERNGGCPPPLFPFLDPKQGVPGTPVPWPRERGCPPALSSPPSRPATGGAREHQMKKDRIIQQKESTAILPKRKRLTINC